MENRNFNPQNLPIRGDGETVLNPRRSELSHMINCLEERAMKLDTLAGEIISTLVVNKDRGTTIADLENEMELISMWYEQLLKIRNE